MPRKLTGKTFVTTGCFEHNIGSLIYDAGGTYDRLQASTDFLIVGKSAGSKYIKAKSLGVTILTEQEFLDYLNGGELPSQEVEVLPAQQLLGEVRSVLQHEPSSKVWHQLVDLVDRCDPENVAIL